MRDQADDEKRDDHRQGNDLVTLAAAVIVIIGMRELASVLVPALTSVFFLLAFLPLVAWLRRKGVSPGWSKVIAIGLGVEGQPQAIGA